MSKVDEIRALGAPAISRQLVSRPKRNVKSRIPGESAEAAAADTAKVVEARVGSPMVVIVKGGLPAGRRRTLVVGDTDGKEPSPCPVCEARKIAHRLRAAKSRAKKVSK
jgi:hypothetical protein